MPTDDQHDGSAVDQHALTPADARTALDDIRTRREQSGAAELRFALSRPSLLTAALLLFVSFASFDLPNPWGGAVLLPGLLLVALLVLRHTYGAPVRNRPGTRGVLLGVVGGLAGYAVFRGLAAALSAGGVPTPHLLSAAVVVGGCLLAAPRVREVADARLRGRADRRR